MCSWEERTEVLSEAVWAHLGSNVREESVGSSWVIMWERARDGAVRQKRTLQLWRASRSRDVTPDFVLLKGDMLPGVCTWRREGKCQEEFMESRRWLGFVLTPDVRSAIWLTGMKAGEEVTWLPHLEEESFDQQIWGKEEPLEFLCPFPDFRGNVSLALQV